MLLSIFLKPPELKDKNQVDFITDDEISRRISGLREKKTSFSNTSFGKTFTSPDSRFFRGRGQRYKKQCITCGHYNVARTNHVVKAVFCD